MFSSRPVVPAALQRRALAFPLPSECGTYTTVKAIFWPWFLDKRFELFPFRSEACLTWRSPRLCSEGRQPFRFRMNVAHIRQSRPDHGPGFKANVLKPFHVVPSCFKSVLLSPRSESHPAVPAALQRRPLTIHQRFRRLLLPANTHFSQTHTL